MYSCGNGDLETVKFLISKGANIKQEDNSGKTPISYASELGSIDVMDYLFECGADIGKDGKNAVISAYESRSYDAIKYLISRGVNIEEIKEALCIAVFLGDIDLVKKIVSNGNDIEETILEKALEIAQEKEYYKIEHYLISKGKTSSGGSGDAFGRSPYTRVARKRNENLRNRRTSNLASNQVYKRTYN